MGIGAIIGGLGSVVSGLFGASASKSASDAQVQQQQAALQLQQGMFNKVQQNLAPYMQYGTSNLGTLLGALPGLTEKFAPTMAQLEQTPGYQFTLGQGLKALDNNFSAQGLGGTSAVWGTPDANGRISTGGPQGPSGALGKALEDYTTGLASNTFQQQFGNYWGQNQNIYNMLSGGVGLGENAAAGVGQAGMTTGQNMSNTLSNIGTAQAQGTLGAAGAINQGISGLTSNAQMALLAGNMNGGNSGFGGLSSLLPGGNLDSSLSPSNFGGSSWNWFGPLSGS